MKYWLRVGIGIVRTEVVTKRSNPTCADADICFKLRYIYIITTNANYQLTCFAYCSATNLCIPDIVPSFSTSLGLFWSHSSTSLVTMLS